MQARVTPLGIPERALTDNGGEFNKEFGEHIEELQVDPLRTAAVSPTQNAACERAGASWKLAAKAVID
eukprot:1192828-Lingulodinium_polyedra.AAC.1